MGPSRRRSSRPDSFRKHSTQSTLQANSRIPNELYLAPANLALKAKILDRMGRSAEADGLFRKSIALVDTMIRRASTLSVERQLLAEMSDIYSAYFAYLSDKNRYEAALQVLENVRGRSESEALEHHGSQSLHQPTPQEQELTRLNIALINTDDPKTRDALLDRIYQTEINLGPSKLATASINHPVTLAQLQRTISPGQLLIEYVLAKPASYALAVTDSSIRAYRLKAGTTIETEVKKYRGEIHAKSADRSLGQALFNDLLAPIQEYSTHKLWGVFCCGECDDDRACRVFSARPFDSPLPFGFQERNQFIFCSKPAFAKMRWNHCFNGLQLFTGICPDVDLCRGQVAVPQPQ
jgi:tetratricopeptide (TPR) repeat protein